MSARVENRNGSSNASHPGGLGNFTALLGFLALCALVSALGGWITATSVGNWYQTLEKPSFNPPDWVFAPVWTALFVMIAVAGWRVWRKTGFAGAKAGFAVYFLQLFLNLAWSFLFFGAQNPTLALAEIVPLLAAILVTAYLFARIDKIAAALFVPYAAWVAFATLLTGAIVVLN